MWLQRDYLIFMLALNTIAEVMGGRAKSRIIVRLAFRTEKVHGHPLQRTFAGTKEVNPDEWGCQNPKGNSDEVQTRKNNRNNRSKQCQHKHFHSLENSASRCVELGLAASSRLFVIAIHLQGL